ncbi:MAG: hypothetical protein E7Z77_06210 [Methanobrevibacter sp.]|uniref:hypothetical protein n=1 Tax=Methanobrevibacter sp. TaxID=66852 RepID=UPI0025D0E09B|nr:hypothetical protein [Methanobrevibacter sp.]MBE6508995.1 hypothetical protein [Methanobrevibacter sp.]
MYYPREYGNHIMSSFEFESGSVLENVNVEYSTSGVPKYDDEGNIINAILYFPTLKGGHSILAKFHDIIYNFNKEDYFFIKITSLGAPGSCSPSTTGLKHNFPAYSVKDRVNFKRQFLAEKFGDIKKVLGLIGEGTGGFDVYTWACEYPDEMEFIMVLNSTYKNYGHRYVVLKATEAMIDSCDDFYNNEYSPSVTKLIVAIAKLRFMFYYSENIFNELNNDEIDVLMDDYVDEALFMDIYDFKSRNDCLLEYDTFDKLSDIKAKSLILGIEDYLSFNTKNDILPLKDIIKDSKIITIHGKESYYKEFDYTEIGLEIVSFLNQFKH